MLSKIGLRRFIAATVMVVMAPALTTLVAGEPAVAKPGIPAPSGPPRVTLGASKVRPEVKARPAYAKFNPAANATLPGAGAKNVRLAKPAQAQVNTIGQDVARKAGVRGVLFTLRSAGKAGPVDVSVDPSTFRNAYGGDYASRLRLVRMPACALTTPELEKCQTQTPVATGAGTPLAAKVSLAATGATVLAATADAAGTSGDYSATSLSPGGSWSVTGNTGAFSYSYPIAVPPPIAGAAPGISLTYNSASQDTRTLGTNNQSSWLGDGWSSGESFIERSYEPCKDVKDSGAPEHDADVCWGGQRLTMSLNGASTPLVYDDDTKVLRPANDDATTKVERLTGATNGTKNGEHFRVTENGVQYYFGLNRLPGWAAGKDETKSAYTMPVYRAHAAVADCPDGDFAETACTLGYRFNLDYVVDTRGNATAYYYDQEIGYYGPAMKNKAVPYVRGGTLRRIDYGMTASTVYSATAPAQIVFTTAERCIAGLPAGNTCADSQFTVSHPEYWPDVPVDLNCTDGKDCTNHAPSFWSRRRLTSIVTQVQVGGATKQVDRYDFVQSFPDGGDHAPTLWLESIKHTGLDRLGGAAADASTSPITFYPIQLANRVGTLPGLPKMYYNRIRTIISESGAETVVDYSTPDCSDVPASDPSDTNDTKAKQYASTNATGCFPVYWTPEAQPAPLMDWFYTHPVTSVITYDSAGNHYQDGSQPKLITEYAYKGKPGWHYDDNEVVKAKYRTWGQFRGYPEVHVTTGDPSVFHYTDGKPVYDRKTLTKTYYFLGMDGDTLPGGKTRDAPALTSQDGSVTVEDKDVYAGRVFETDVYTGVGGTIDQATVTVPTSIGPTATRARTGLPALNAQMVRTAKVLTRQAVSYGWRKTEVATFYNTTLGQSTTGMPVQVADRGEVGAAGNVPKCTFTRYLDGKNAAMVVPAETIVRAQDCPSAGATPSGTLISDERTSYDGNPFAYNGDGQSNPAKPAIGNVTLVQKASDASGAFLDDTAQTFDSYGRVTSTTHLPKSTGLSKTTYRTITPATGALPTSIVTTSQVTSGASCATVTASSVNCQRETLTLDPARQVATEKLAADNSRNSLTYDGLGRLTAVWLPNRSKLAGAAASITYKYDLKSTGPSVVTTNTLLDDGTYSVTKVLSDALLRPLEKQVSGENGSTTVTDTQYDSHGWSVVTNNAYATAGNPVDTLISDRVSQVTIPSTTVTDHDGMGRATQVTTEHNGVQVTRSRTAYTGDKTTVVPPAGTVATTSTTDARGQTTSLAQYTVAPTLSGNLSDGFTAAGGASQSIRYGYTPAGQQATVTGPDESVWKFEYDQLGRQISRTDPDTGTALTSYDDAGNITSTKDARGIQLTFTYDLLGRKLTAIDKTKSNFKYASWTYDTLKIGKLTSSSRYVSGVTGAYTVAVTGYSAMGKPLGQTVTLPSVEKPLPVSYTTKFRYTPNVELLAQQEDPAVGNLPGETITYGYSTLGAATTTSGVDLYVSGTVYTDFGTPSRVTMGASSNEAQVLYSYDETTLRLSQRSVYRTEGIGPLIDRLTYAYDDAGNPLSITDEQSESGNTVTDTQCYRYDGLTRLVDAWTAAGACPAATTVKPAAGTVATGPGSYWQSFEYDVIGNRKQSVEHSTSGGSDVTTGYQNGCTTSCNRTGTQPHTLTATTGAAAATLVYDVAGNLLTRANANGTGQNLKWDDEGHLAEVATTGAGAGITKYLYDADGNQLIRREPGRTTLFAGDTQVVVDTAAATPAVLGAVRSYAHGGTGAPVAVRSSLPGGGAHYLFNDAHGTATLAMDTTTQQVTRQQYKPYGETRISANTLTWPDPSRGYLAAPKSNAAGYTDLGARKYDPVLGRFISPDPVLETSDPNQLGGYTYAGDNPVTNADPSGKMLPMDERGAPPASSYKPLTQPNPTTIVDQNNVPHRLLKGSNVSKDQGTVSYLNRHLKTAGELYDASTGNGSMFFLQDENNPIVGKGTVDLEGGAKTVRGTTSDAIKVSWLNGKMVSVDSYDFTEGKPDRNEAHANTARNKMSTEVVDGKKPKMQTQNVVFVAESDTQAADMHARLKDNPNVRIVNPNTGWDSGELYSDTHWKALKGAGLGGAKPRTTTAEVEGSRGGRVARGGGAALGALSVVGDLYAAFKFGKALSSDDPLEMDQFMCEFTFNPVSCYNVNVAQNPYNTA
ncbi:RHS repeat domain-containing protein [Actinoplanes sp. CA-131856]